MKIMFTILLTARLVLAGAVFSEGLMLLRGLPAHHREGAAGVSAARWPTRTPERQGALEGGPVVETWLALTRATVLIGTVLFGFILLGAGFYFVYREYRMIRNWDQLLAFVKETGNTKFGADAAEG